MQGGNGPARADGPTQRGRREGSNEWCQAKHVPEVETEVVQEPPLCVNIVVDCDDRRIRGRAGGGKGHPVAAEVGHDDCKPAQGQHAGARRSTVGVNAEPHSCVPFKR